MSNVPQDVIDDAVAAGLIPQPSRFLDAAYFEKIGKFAQLRAQRSNAEPVAGEHIGWIYLVDGELIFDASLHKPVLRVTPDGIEPVDDSKPVFTGEANVFDAGVAAGMTRAAEICEANDMSWADDVWNSAVKDCAKKIFSAIPADSKAALREVCMKVAIQVYVSRNTISRQNDDADLKAIVDAKIGSKDRV